MAVLSPCSRGQMIFVRIQLFELSATSRSSAVTGKASVVLHVHAGPILSNFTASSSRQIIGADAFYLEVSAYSGFANSAPFLYLFSYEFDGFILSITDYAFQSFTDSKI